MQKRSSGSSRSRGIGLVKQIMGILGSMVKAKSMELKSKTRELKTRLIIFWLLKDKKVLLGSNQHLSPSLQSLLTNHHQPPLPVDSIAPTKEEEKEEQVEGLMRMMMSKQGIQLAKMYKKKKIAMSPVHTTTTTTTMPSVDHDDKPTATAEEEEEVHLVDREEEQEGKNDKEDDEEDVDLMLTEQPWKFAGDKDENTTDYDYDYDYNSNKEGESVVVDEDKDDDDHHHINIDEAADLFIRNFRHQLKLQKNQISS
ncbi:hypothetical protein LguiA_019800 [Lonicera macranthoides]